MMLFLVKVLAYKGFTSLILPLNLFSIILKTVSPNNIINELVVLQYTNKTVLKV